MNYEGIVKMCVVSSRDVGVSDGRNVWEIEMYGEQDKENQ